VEIYTQSRAELELTLPKGSRLWSTMLMPDELDRPRCQISITATGDSETDARETLTGVLRAIHNALAPHLLYLEGSG
jgi:hypothetical protein